MDIALLIGGAVETDLLGRKVAVVSRSAGRLTFRITLWKIRTLDVVPASR